MKFSRLPSAAFAWALSAVTLVLPAAAALPPPPTAQTVPVADTYFGTQVVDPYRWMETPNNPDLAVYLKAQNDRTHAARGRKGAVLSALPRTRA